MLYGCRMTNNAHSCHDVDSLDETVQQLLDLMQAHLKEVPNQEPNRGISQTVTMCYI